MLQKFDKHLGNSQLIVLLGEKNSDSSSCHCMYKSGSYDCLDQRDTLGVQHLNDILRISVILSHANLFLLATVV